MNAEHPVNTCLYVSLQRRFLFAWQNGDSGGDAGQDKLYQQQQARQRLNNQVQVEVLHMRVAAEEEGKGMRGAEADRVGSTILEGRSQEPALSSSFDPRITPIKPSNPNHHNLEALAQLELCLPCRMLVIVKLRLQKQAVQKRRVLLRQALQQVAALPGREQQAGTRQQG